MDSINTGLFGFEWAEEPHFNVISLVVKDHQYRPIAQVLVDITKAELCGLWVSPERRRKGIAKNLIARACDILKSKGHDRINASHHNDNEEVRKLFAACGFFSMIKVEKRF